MKLTTHRDAIRNVANRWIEQYAPFTNDLPLFSFRNGLKSEKTKKQISEELDALNKETATPQDVASIIGNESWTRLVCNECNKEVDAILTVGEEPDYESHTADLCMDCVRKAFSFANDPHHTSDTPGESNK